MCLSRWMNDPPHETRISVDVVDPVAFTSRGRAVREWIEASTNAQQQPVLDAIGDDYDELLGYLEPWAAAIVGAGYYPSDIRQLPPHWGQLPDDGAQHSGISS